MVTSSGASHNALAEEVESNLKEVLNQEVHARESVKRKLTDVPDKHVTSAQKQYQQVESCITNILKDVHGLYAQNLTLREKIRMNLNSESKKFGFLKHSLQLYFDCIPLVDLDGFTALMNKDKEIWRTYYQKAAEEAKQFTEGYAKLIEEQKKQLEIYLQESKKRLLEVPELPEPDSMTETSFMQLSSGKNPIMSQSQQSLMSVEGPSEIAQSEVSQTKSQVSQIKSEISQTKSEVSQTKSMLMKQPAVFIPEITKLPVFGDPSQKVDLEFPKIEDLVKFPHGKVIKLRGICWRNGHALMALGLKFTNGVESPLFQKDEVAKLPQLGEYAVKEADVDPQKKISKISVKTGKSNTICALRLQDAEDQMILDIEWLSNSKAEWVTHSIDDSQELIGLYMSKQGHNDFIQSLGFVVWKNRLNITE